MTQISESFININSLAQNSVTDTPFPYMIIPNFINAEHLATLVNEFPDITHRGSIPSSSVQCTPAFQKLLDELTGTALRNIIADKFSIDLTDKPTMVTLRGFTTERDGVIHTDSKSKLITVLLYMNPHWETHQGKLRLLKNQHNLDDYVEEISPLAGNCLIFKVTANGWHGHHPFIGKRLSLQLNYLANDAALIKHLNHHRFTAFLKKYLPTFFFKNDEKM